MDAGLLDKRVLTTPPVADSVRNPFLSFIKSNLKLNFNHRA
jgi:hypothetical protein